MLAIHLHLSSVLPQVFQLQVFQLRVFQLRVFQLRGPEFQVLQELAQQVYRLEFLELLAFPWGLELLAFPL